MTKKQNKFNHTNRKKKHTVVAFDENQRDQYLKNMFGAKKRRKAEKKKYAEEKIQETKKLEKK